MNDCALRRNRDPSGILARKKPWPIHIPHLGTWQFKITRRNGAQPHRNARYAAFPFQGHRRGKAIIQDGLTINSGECAKPG
jgi:hypothetical protein